MSQVVYRYVNGRTQPLSEELKNDLRLGKYGFIDLMDQVRLFSDIDTTHVKDRVWMETNLSPSKLVIIGGFAVFDNDYDAVLQELIDEIRDVSNIDLTDVLTIHDIDPSSIYAIYLVAINEESNYKMPKHVHSSLTDSNNVEYDSKTVTVVVPTKIVDELATTACFNYQEHMPCINVLGTGGFSDDVVGNVQYIDLPKEGQYLILNFNSTKTLHWVENVTGSKNEYLCITMETMEKI